MTADDRCNLVLTFARTLFINGQATDQTGAAAERLARTLGLRANLMARWGELQLQPGGKDATLIPADPAGVDMDPGRLSVRGGGGVGAAGAGCRNEGDRRDLAGAAVSNMAFRVCSGGRSRGAVGDLRRWPFPS